MDQIGICLKFIYRDGKVSDFSPLIKTEAITIWVLVKATMATLTVGYPSVCDSSKVDQVNGR